MPKYLTIYLVHILVAGLLAGISDRLIILLGLLSSMLLLSEVWHFILFYLAYELTVFVLLPVLTVSSRSYRKCWALTTLYVVLVLGAVLFYMLLILDLLESHGPSSAC